MNQTTWSVPRETKLAIPLPTTAPNPALRIASHVIEPAGPAEQDQRGAGSTLRITQVPAPVDRKPIVPTGVIPSAATPTQPRAGPDDDGELTQAQREELWQILALPSDKKARNGKRSAPDSQYSKARHAASEKKRREELNVVFDHIRTKIPSSVNGDESSRLTKLDILTQTEEYIKRLEQAAYGLLQENRSMKATMYSARPSKEQLW